ncbi:hypothetical protein JTE90_013165 [Oedothorax gibbosus]|uniref:Reverse transcriptase/retrotransposon-derived protein RNase H-like domain-containing protein n=1 Tax=Oedothorax gibbosus TaxID=931172 RepID=A0AAV6UAZ6_9ARAC|nr:hypothetical protein JTE90_013165 [Oedothorax gibbosus]
MFSSIAAPLTDSLKGKARKGPITWTKECEEAFDKLKNCLCNYPVLYSPDYQKPFIVETDASDQGMGVVLSQLADNETEEHPIIYLSKKFTSVEKRYSVTREVKILGHLVSSCGVRPDPDKVKAVSNFPTPQNVHDIRSFLGLCSYFRRFIKGFCYLAEPLQMQLKVLCIKLS